MADKKAKIVAEKSPIKKENDEVVTINLQPFLVPVSILLSGLIIATGVLVGLNNVAGSLKGSSVAGTNTTTDTTGTTPDTTTNTGTTNVTSAQLKGLFSNGNITFGDVNSKVIFVEASDPSCPYCHIASGDNPDLNKAAGSQFTLVADGGSYVSPVKEMRKLVDQGKAAFVWIYDNGHGNGEMGTKALYCAYEKNKFWEAHDLLMSRAGYKILNGYDIDQSTVSADQVVGNDKTKSQLLADFLKSAVDSNFMKSCLDSGKYDSRLASDVALAKTLGVNGTPGFFVNTTAYPGAYSWTDMQATVNTFLQ